MVHIQRNLCQSSDSVEMGLLKPLEKLHVGFEIHENTKERITVMNVLNQPSFGDPHDSH